MTMTYRLRNIIIATVLAALAATLAAVYVSTSKQHATTTAKPVTLFVAAKDIPVGTPGSKLVTGGYAKQLQVARTAVASGAVTDLNAVARLAVSQPIYAGDQLTTRRFDVAGAQGIRANLTGKTRAVQLAGDANQLLAGTLRTGDRVDVLAGVTLPEGSQHHLTRVIARNILVLQAPAKPDSSTKLTSSTQSLSVQLALTDDQAQQVFFAAKYGDWELMLRPVKKPANSAPKIDSSWTVLTRSGRDTSLAQQAR